MKSITLDASHVPSDRGRILLTFWRPVGACRSAVLLVPPFAEEMNKSRRMFALLGQALAARGAACVLPDLFGTGDSEGEFVEADWDGWQQDLGAASKWCAQHLATIEGLVALRLGAALAADASEADLLPPLQRVVLWQPVFDCDRHLTQFLRMRTAASLTQDGRGETVEQLRRRLHEGGTVEVAGYEVGSDLARALAGRHPQRELPAGWRGVHWMEIQRTADAPLPAPSQKIIEMSRAGGRVVESWATTGEPFWASTEIATSRPMVERCVEALAS